MIGLVLVRVCSNVWERDMRVLRNSKFAVVMGLVLVVLVGFCLVPSFGLARVEMSIDSGVVQGDPTDALGSGGSDGDVEDGLDGPIIWMLGDAGAGMDHRGEPHDGLDYFKIFSNPGELVMGYEDTPIFGYFRVP
jgi:hypothetical protein